jgi:hypothetical protein
MSTERPHNPAQATELVRDLLAVIEHLSHGSLDPDWPARFVSIREDVDVGAEVNPVVARAEAFLREAVGAGETACRPE